MMRCVATSRSKRCATSCLMVSMVSGAAAAVSMVYGNTICTEVGALISISIVVSSVLWYRFTRVNSNDDDDDDAIDGADDDNVAIYTDTISP